MASMAPLRLGTRSSALARWQSDWVADRLSELGVEIEIIPITTSGDVTRGPLGQIGGQGLFTKEIQKALLEDRIDLAVHSLKDLPTEPIDGLSLAAVPTREHPGDALVSGCADSIENLPAKARVGTGSIRRRAQLLHQRSDLQVLDIRGNLDTRLKKLDEGQYDAIILAQAGLRRLGWEDRITQPIPLTTMLPAIGQGALGIETRSDDARTQDCLKPIDDTSSHSAVLAERTLLHTLRGGCLAPVGAWGRVEGGELKLTGVVLSGDGTKRIEAEFASPAESAKQIGEKVARGLLDQGADKLLAEVR